jgi:hypothetical protein
LSSALDLPELPPAPGTADVSIAFGHVELPAGTDVHGHVVTPDLICLRFPEVGSFLIRGGDEIVVDAEPGLGEDVIRNFVLGPAMGALMHQRGHLVLHASAVALGGVAAAFLGDSEWGKSTTAAACYLAGNALIADDTTAVDLTRAVPTAIPAIPRIKLWPESMRALSLDPDRYERVHAELDKRQLPAPRGFPGAPVPIGAIYILGDGPQVGVEPHTGHEAVIDVVRHSYAVDLLQATGTQGRHFLQCTDLVGRVPVRRLVTGGSLDAIRRIPAAVADDLS